MASVDLGADDVEELLLPAFNVLDTDEFVVRGIPSSWRTLQGRGEPPTLDLDSQSPSPGTRLEAPRA